MKNAETLTPLTGKETDTKAEYNLDNQKSRCNLKNIRACIIAGEFWL